MAAIDLFATAPGTESDFERVTGVAPTSPARYFSAVTPDNSNDLAYATRALWVGGAGNLSVIDLDGNTVAFTGIPAGTLLPIRVARVRATGTTATNIVALV